MSDSNATMVVGLVSSAVAERDRLRAYVAKLEAYGQQLANCAYTLKQLERLDQHTRDCLAVAQEGWDEARRTRGAIRVAPQPSATKPPEKP